jgi:hypothetical protein
MEPTVGPDINIEYINTKPIRKTVTICLLILASIASTSFTVNEANSIPPIQKFLDKIKRDDSYTKPTRVSQKLTGNTFIVTLNSSSMNLQETYSGMDWSEFYRYSYKEYKDYFVVEFYFFNSIAYQLDDEELGITNEVVDSFKCNFLPEDKEEVLAVLETWEENLED